MAVPAMQAIFKFEQSRSTDTSHRRHGRDGHVTGNGSMLNSWHLLQIFVFHDPTAFWKTRRVAFGRAVPPRGHHRDGSEQSAVRGQIEREIIALINMPIGK